jgi:hypothetical protein
MNFSITKAGTAMAAAALVAGAILATVPSGSVLADEDDMPMMGGPGTMMGPGYGPGRGGGYGPGYGPGMMGPGMMGPGMMGGYGYGPGMMMGPGMMGGYGYGPGMMGGYGPGMMGPGWGQHMRGGWGHGPMMGPGMMGGYGYGPCPGWERGQGAKGGALTADDVRAMLEQRLEWSRNPNLKVGDVSEKGDTITGEIVTKDGSLVSRIQVDKNTGWMRPAN